MVMTVSIKPIVVAVWGVYGILAPLQIAYSYPILIDYWASCIVSEGQK